MKLRNYLLLAILSTGLFACNKGEEMNTDPKWEGAKTVTLKVATSTPVKSITEPSTGKDRTMEFNDLLIVFYNQGTGNIFHSEKLTDADLTAAITDAGYTFHNLNPMIDAAAVVANSDGENTLTAAVNTNISALKAAVLDIPKQQTMANNILLFDAQALVSNETITDEGHEGGEATNKFKVTLNPKPQVARLEIGNIQCTDLGTYYDKFTVAGMGFMNFAPTQTGWSNTYLAPVTPTYGTTVTYDQDGFDALVAANNTWNYDAATGTTEISSSTTQYNPTAGKFCYNFFPNVMPHLKLKLSGVHPKGSSNPLSQDVYVTVTKYHFPDGVTTFEAGKIYQLDFTFTEKNLGLYDNKQICVEATVTIDPWVIVPGLTPDFSAE